MPSLTRQDLTTLISQLVGDPNNQTWSTAIVQSKIEKAQEKFVLDTRVLLDSAAATTLVANQAEYDLPIDVLDVIRVVHNGNKLIRTSKFDLDFSNPNDWSDDKGSPTHYWIDLDPNNKKIGIYPLPQGDDTSHTLGIEYLKIPPALTTDASVPLDGHTLLTPYHDALAYWSARELLKETPTTENIAKMSTFNQSYESLVSDCIETFKHMGQPVSWRMQGGRYFRGL